MLLKIFLICSIFLIIKICAEIEYCEPDNEVKNPKNLKLWDKVMEKLDDFTFKNNYTISCENNTTNHVTIDAKGDFLWDLRFKLYNETTNLLDKQTLQDCYSVGNNANEKNCDIDKFQKCMYSVRDAMFLELISFWESEIQKELEKLAKNC